MQKDSTYEGDTNQDDTFDQGEDAPDQHTYSEDMPQEPTVDDSHPVENQREKRKRSRPKHLKDFIVNPPPPLRQTMHHPDTHVQSRVLNGTSTS